MAAHHTHSLESVITVTSSTVAAMVSTWNLPSLRLRFRPNAAGCKACRPLLLQLLPPVRSQNILHGGEAMNHSQVEVLEHAQGELEAALAERAAEGEALRSELAARKATLEQQAQIITTQVHCCPYYFAC